MTDTTTLEVFGTILLTGATDGPKRFGHGQLTIEHGTSIDGTPWTRLGLVSADGVRFASVSLMGEERGQLAGYLGPEADE